ncbi:hypothetical protein AAE02nite_18180 [Adhaeribacter aerolatus]|uniref:Uncharacterized protein n=1 Tax=Adhaeribacter aerolatus TaxID=670289 RepID=A0A512AWT5_9BACT|nr:hypothetical protein AAE02nite_18180 [Adhaeribacter aerolatus]
MIWGVFTVVFIDGLRVLAKAFVVSYSHRLIKAIILIIMKYIENFIFFESNNVVFQYKPRQ